MKIKAENFNKKQKQINKQATNTPNYNCRMQAKWHVHNYQVNTSCDCIRNLTL